MELWVAMITVPYISRPPTSEVENFFVVSEREIDGETRTRKTNMTDNDPWETVLTSLNQSINVPLRAPPRDFIGMGGGLCRKINGIAEISRFTC